MRLRILAPFRSHFRLSLGYTLKTGRLSVFSRDYLAFWDGLQKAADQAASDDDVRFLHSQRYLGPDVVRYTTIDEDALRYTAKLIELRPRGNDEVTSFDGGEFGASVELLAQRRLAGKAAYDKLVDGVSIIPQSTVVRVFDNNISLFETELRIADALLAPVDGRVEPVLDELREFAVFTGEALIEHYYAELVFPLLRRIAEDADRDHVFVDRLYRTRNNNTEQPEGLDRFHYPLTMGDHDRRAATEVLWVTRSLICEDDDGDNLDLEAIVHTWLRAVGDRTLTEKVAKDPHTYSTRWLNYLFREGFVEHGQGMEFRDVWEAMQLCQYYYSAVESLNDRLNRVLAYANQERAKRNLRHLHEMLDDTVRRCELVLVNYNEIQKYLKRDKFVAFRDIMGYWNFADMEVAVREKMSLCRNRLAALSDRASEKGRLYTDLLLMVLSLMTVLDTSISLALFGRSPTDTVYAQDDAYSGFILAQFARWQPHWIIIVAFVLVALLGLRFYFFRRKRLLYD